jgi:hypothetical protein
MKIYKTHYLPENNFEDSKIYQIHGLAEQNIRQSYTGGAVDVYIPHNKKDNELIDLFYYDVNSLYPSRMLKLDMPIGKPVAFEGNIRKLDPNAYGFFYCKITSPDYLEYPILQRKIKTSEGIRTVPGLGSWEGWICSTEMDNAVKSGYLFEIIKGYQFKTADIFSEFLINLYNLRLNYEKGTPMNLIAKLLMNSLYGKFGMKDEITRMEIFNNMTDLDQEIISLKLDLYGPSIKDIVKLENHTIFVINTSVDLTYNEKDDFYHGTEVNIAIASAITASARIFMSFFKNNPDFKLYYMDTDSGFINKPLPDYLLGNKFGQFKLENVITKAVFLAPKVYGFITDEGREIIKVKGLNKDNVNSIKFYDLEALLIKDSSREFTQEKWFKSVIKGEITLDDIAYTLKVTSNKRELIYKNGIFNSTKPYNYDEIT